MPAILPTLLLILLVAPACDVPDSTPLSATRAGVAAEGVEPPQSPDLRRVWARAGDYASPSPDGRRVAFVDWSTGDVAVRDLQTGEEERVTDKGSWAEDGSWAEEPIFSPDGRRVAYSYGNVKRPNGEWRYELQMVELGSTEQHLLHALTPQDEWIVPLDWSSERGIATAITREDGAGELALIDPDTRAMTSLGTYSGDEAQPRDAWFSPDQGWLAYRRGDRAYVRSLAADGRESRIDLPVMRVLGWAPDGDALLVHTRHQGQSGIWAVPVATTGETGEPLLIRAGLPSVVPSGRAGDRYYYGVVVDAPKIYTATVDAAAGRVLADPVSLTSPLDGRAGLPAWSQDGKSLAYVIEDPVEGGLRFLVREADGDAVREVAHGDFRLGAILGLRWAEGGSALVFASLDDGRNGTFYRLDLATGEIEKTSDEGAWSDFDILPDGRSVLILTTEQRRTGAALAVRDLGSGSTRVVVELPDSWEAANVAVSRDGEQAALVHRDTASDASTLSVVRLADGHIRDLFTVEAPAHLEIARNALGWHPEGSHVLVMSGAWEQPEGHRLLAVSVDGGEPVTLLDGNEWRSMALHPDGRQLAFSKGSVRTELWALDSISEAMAEARSGTGQR